MSIGNWYRVGSVAVTNGSVNVVGTGTFWTSQCNPGDRFTVDGENWYEVNSITDDTHLTILSVGGSGGFAGATASNLAYAIDRNFTNNLNANIAASVASLVAQYQANSNGPLSGLFGNGAAATPGIAFLNEASTGLFHPATGVAALAVQGAEILRVVGSAAGVPAMIGQGTTAPANAHDITFSYNALFGVGVANTSSGTAARASFTASNGTQQLRAGVNGANFTANGVLTASRGFVEGPTGVDFASGVTAGTAFSWGTGAAYTAAMTMDYAGNVELVTGKLGIGMTPANVIDITQSQNAISYVSLLNGNTGVNAAATLQVSNGTSLGQLFQYGTGVTASGLIRPNGTLLNATGAGGLTINTGSAHPIYVGINNAQVAEFDTSGNLLIGTTAVVGSQSGIAINRTAGFAGVGLQSSGGYAGSVGIDITSGATITGSPAGALAIRGGGPILFSSIGTGAEVARFDTSGRFGIGMTPSNVVDIAWNNSSGASVSLVNPSAGTTAYSQFASSNGTSGMNIGIGSTGYTTNGVYQANRGYVQATGVNGMVLTTTSNTPIVMAPNGTEAARFVSGCFAIGTTSASNVMTVQGPNSMGTRALVVNDETGSGALYTDTCDQTVSTGENSAHSALYLRKNSSTSRSLSAAGTLNASGADYAEYRQLIASLYGVVSKGALLGYNAAGLMTNVFADVVGRVLPKSTAPSYVGNDTWGTEAAITAAYGVAALGDAPAPVVEPVAPIVVADPGPDATAEQSAAYAAHQAAAAAYPAQQAAYATYQTDLAAYHARVTAFNAALATERVKWDRIALCGVVPVNLSGLTAADIGKYLVPCAASDGTITATAVAKADLTLMQYIDSFGTVEMIGPDGRPLVNVKNG